MTEQVHKPYFSIIVPVYNRAHLIGKTLDTIFGQTFDNYEIIIIDDSSTDNIQDALAPYKHDERLRYFRNMVNSERSFSRNRGMEVATGRFATFLDSDDYMYKNCLADAYNFSIKNTQYHIFFNRYELVTPNGQHLYTYPIPNLKNPIAAISKMNFFSCIGTFISEVAYKRVRFDEDPKIIPSEDYLFWLTAVGLFPKVGLIDKVNCAMAQHSGRSMNAVTTDETFERVTALRSKVLSNPEIGPVYKPYINVLNSSAALFTASVAFQSNEFNRARKYLRIALNAYPNNVFSSRFLRMSVRAIIGIKNSA